MTSGSELATTNRLELNKAGSLLPNTIPGSMSDSVLSYFPPGQGRYLDAIWVTLAGERLAKKRRNVVGILGKWPPSQASMGGANSFVVVVVGEWVTKLFLRHCARRVSD